MVIVTNCPPLEATCTDCRTSYNLREAMASDRAASLTGWKDAFRCPQEVPDEIADAAAAGLPMRSAYAYCTFNILSTTEEACATDALATVEKVVCCQVKKPSWR